MPAQGVLEAHLLSDGPEVSSILEPHARSAVEPAQSTAPSPSPFGGGTVALIVADGDVPDPAALDAAWPGWRAGVSLVVAADGGWSKAHALGLRPDVLVGDADSLSDEAFEAAAAGGVQVERSAVAKDESDTELALLAALRRGATRVTILGALGGSRLDHTIANLGLLALPDPTVATIELLDATTRVRLLRTEGESRGEVGVEPAELPLPGRIGDLVSLLPFGASADGVTTYGLEYPLRAEPLSTGPARGLSNVRIAANARVSLRSGRLLVIETLVGSTATATAPAAAAADIPS